MAGVTGEILDQDQVDEPQVDIAGAGMRLGALRNPGCSGGWRVGAGVRVEVLR